MGGEIRPSRAGLTTARSASQSFLGKPVKLFKNNFYISIEGSYIPEY